MTPFNLLYLLPPFLDITIESTGENFTNCSPRLTMVGSKIRLSYGDGTMDCPLYIAQNDIELIREVKKWAEILYQTNGLVVPSVMIGGYQYPEP